MSETADRLRVLADLVDNSEKPLSVAVIISGPLHYELACVASNDPERDAMGLGLSIYQDSNMRNVVDP